MVLWKHFLCWALGWFLLGAVIQVVAFLNTGIIG